MWYMTYSIISVPNFYLSMLFFYLSLRWFFCRISPSFSAIARGFFLPKRKRSARWSLILLQFSAILKLLIFHYYEDSEKYICTNHSFRVGLASHSAYWKMSDNAIKLLGQWNTNVFNLTSEMLICVLRPNHII